MVRAIHAGAGLFNGAVFTTDAQPAGRGQGENRWHSSPAENLTLSAFLEPDHLSVDDLFRLTEIAALAVADTIADFLPPDLAARVRVKWPNDVYVGHRKIAGILIQNGLRGERIGWSVLGIGLNVNERSFPPELADRATSLHLLTGTPADRAAVLRSLFSHLRTHYLASRSAIGQLRLAAAYHDRLYLRGQTVTFRETASGIRFRAEVIGVTPEGRLRLRGAEGVGEYALREIVLDR